jgi:aspartyl-tRNA(Asn)/glutamyl-tRNA(Gln) amidotransferase subunit B
MKLYPKIGLEIHLQLKTVSKMFCDCPLPSLNSAPNSVICPVCLGHPGTLPRLNRQALEKGMILAQALGSKINPRIRFDRKNYFYPDLPKGYQISQHGAELASGGTVLVDYLSFDKKHSESFSVKLSHIHIEEDTGKLMHEAEHSLVDFNRAGVPLLEIVSEPVINSPREARLFAKELQRIARMLGVSDADMENGGLRVDANVSVAPVGQLGTKVEVKNLNSFAFLEKALAFEVGRQSDLVLRGQKIIHETRGWDQKSGRTLGQRTKEASADYRYFPEPDLPEIILDKKPKLSAKLPGELRRQALKILQPAKVYMLDDLGKLAEFLKKADAKTADKIAAKLLSGQSRRAVFGSLPTNINQIINKIIAKNPQQAHNFKQGKKEVINFFVGEIIRELKGQADPRGIRDKVEKALTNL